MTLKQARILAALNETEATAYIFNMLTDLKNSSDPTVAQAAEQTEKAIKKVEQGEPLTQEEQSWISWLF